MPYFHPFIAAKVANQWLGEVRPLPELEEIGLLLRSASITPVTKNKVFRKWLEVSDQSPDLSKLNNLFSKIPDDKIKSNFVITLINNDKHFTAISDDNSFEELLTHNVSDLSLQNKVRKEFRIAKIKRRCSLLTFDDIGKTLDGFDEEDRARIVGHWLTVVDELPTIYQLKLLVKNNFTLASLQEEVVNGWLKRVDPDNKSYNYEDILSSISIVSDLSQQDDLLGDNFIVGESHNEPFARKFFTLNAQLLAQKGFNAFFVEGFDEKDTELFKQWSKTKVLPESLKEKIDTFHNLYEVEKTSFSEEFKEHNFLTMLTAMAESGITIVGIENEDMHQKMSCPNVKEENIYRDETFLAIMKKYIQENPETKYVASMGTAHVLSSNNYEKGESRTYGDLHRNTVPEQLGVASIAFSSKRDYSLHSTRDQSKPSQQFLHASRETSLELGRSKHQGDD
ncbi:MAG: hypothetical protein ACJAVG_001229, partial [Rickettsiales bacterium]